jgi:Methyltransferase domain
MNLAHFRLHNFYRWLKPFSEKHRAQRMQKFLEFLGSCQVNNPKILDLGGHPTIWEFINIPLDITILNLPGHIVHSECAIHHLTYVEGDACNVSEYKDISFDLVFSNSVIEHVGGDTNQEKFAHEVQRLAKYHWVQTPSKYFPIEAHCGMPFWWFWPESLRRAFIARWRLKTPKWTEMVEGTTVLTKQRIQKLFPDSEIFTEKSFGFTKSYIAHSQLMPKLTNN